MSNSIKPAVRIRISPITASIWKNQKEKGVFYSVEFTRSYRDEAGNWQTSSSFNVSELLLLAHIASKAHDEIHKLKAGDRQTEQPEEAVA